MIAPCPRWLLATLALGLVCLLDIACDRVAKEVAREVASATVPVVKAPEIASVTSAEAEAFARELIAAVEVGDAARVESRIDYDALIRRAADGLRLPAKVLADTVRGAQQGARETGLIFQLAGLTARGDTLTSLGTRQEGAKRWATLRMLAKAGGLEHFDCLLSKTEAGGVVAVDVRLLSTGELMSETMRRVLIPVFAADKNNVERLTQRENVLLEHLSELRAAQQARAAGEPARAADLVEGLPDELKHQKFCMLLWLQAAAASGDDARYSRALAALLERFPNDPAASVAAIDHYFLKKQYDKALSAIAHVAKHSAPDPYFRVLEANALIEMGRMDDALKAARAAIEREPGLLDAHFLLLTAQLRAKDHAAAAQTMLSISREFALSFDIGGVPEYAEFARSSEYAAIKGQVLAGVMVASRSGGGPAGKPEPARSQEVPSPPVSQPAVVASAPEPPGPATERSTLAAGSARTWGDVAFRWIPPGSFQMGSPGDDTEADADERPAHRVTLTRGFWLAETEVTQRQWRSVMGNNPSYHSDCDPCPVEKVSWYDALAYCDKLSVRAGLRPCYGVERHCRGEPGRSGYTCTDGALEPGLDCDGFRLPTEAEWEYAARAGTTGPRYGEVAEIAWYEGNSGDNKTHPVAGKDKNAWGLRDMLGNVYEWVWDWEATYDPQPVEDPTGPPSGSLRVYRAGSFLSSARFVRAAYRSGWGPADRYGVLGFRPARSAP